MNEIEIIMIQQEVFEINQKIKQIKGVLHKRKQKVNEWNPHYRHILQDTPSKQTYLERGFSWKKLCSRSHSLNEGELKAKLKNYCLQSRHKIHTFYNELKELEKLKQRKKRIHIESIEAKKEKLKSKEKQNIQKSQIKDRGKVRTLKIIQTDSYARSDKDRLNPFQGCKIEKFIEFFEQNKGNQEQIGEKVMKYLGIGLETTPIGPLLRHNERRQLNNKAESEWVAHNKSLVSQQLHSFDQMHVCAGAYAVKMVQLSQNSV